MHSHRLRAGTAMGVMAGLVASSLAMAPVGSTAEDEAGNNLAFPVLWSEDGYQLTPPGTMGETDVSGTLAPCDEDGTVQAAVQKDPGNSWQADNVLSPGNSVTSVDWGDNLESKDWRVGQVVRVETALYANVDPTMTGYEMCYVSGSGQDEVWGAVVSSGGGGMESAAAESALEARAGNGKGSGKDNQQDAPSMNDESPTDEENAPQGGTDGADPVEEQAVDEPGNGDGAGRTLTEYESTEAMVYSAGARLTIQRIDSGASPTWDSTQHRWVGEGVADPVFNGAIHEKTTEGPGGYGAEINVSGKLVYGFVWRTADLFNGEYRVTFSLDGPTDSFLGTGTSLAEATIRASEESDGEDLAMRSLAADGAGSGSGGGHGGGGEEGGNTAVVVGDQNLSYIDVGLTDGEDPPPTPEPTPEPTSEPTAPAPAPGPDSGSGTATDTGGTSNPAAPVGPPIETGVPVQPASPVQVLPRIRQTAELNAPTGRKVKVRTRLMLTEEPVYTDWGVTVRWRVTKRSEDNCTIRNRNGEQTVKFTKRGRCAVVAWAPSPNPFVVAPFNEKKIYKVRNSL